jgi:hypothetical protein
VDTDTMLVVTAHVSQACNNKREAQPTILAIQALPEELGQVQSLIADNGYFSQATAQACSDAGIAPQLHQAHACAASSVKGRGGLDADSNTCSGAFRNHPGRPQSPRQTAPARQPIKKPPCAANLGTG